MFKEDDLDKRVLAFEEKWDQLRLMIDLSSSSEDDKCQMLALCWDLIEIFYDVGGIEL